MEKEKNPTCFEAAKLKDLNPGACVSIDLEGKCGIALVNLDGEIFALDNTCPHAGGPLGDGTIEGEYLTCPWHGWKFHVRTGQRRRNPCDDWKVPRYETRIVDGVIQVLIPQT